MFVPTYLYKRLTFTGADFAAPRAALTRLGFTCHFVETQDDGAVEANAELVIGAIRARAQSGRRYDGRAALDAVRVRANAAPILRMPPRRLGRE